MSDQLAVHAKLACQEVHGQWGLADPPFPSWQPNVPADKEEGVGAGVAHSCNAFFRNKLIV